VESLDRLFQAIPLDEAHGVEGPAVGVAAQTVDRHDAGMLELAGDLGFQQETRAALRLSGVPRLDFLEGDVTVEFLVAGHEHLAQAALGVRTQDAKTGEGTGGTAGDLGAGGTAGGLGAGGVGIELRPVRGDVQEAGLHIPIANLPQVLADRAEGADGG